MPPHELSIFVATWNVNGKMVKDDLSTWLTPPGTGPKPDLYVLGFQEFDLTKESFVQNDEKRLKYWQDKIEAVISLQGAYKCVATSQLASMLVLLYAPEELANQMHDLDTAMVGTGYAGIMGNKGAVAIRFVYNGTSFCLVNSHLNAHVHNVRRRQADYESICSRMVFFADEPVDVGLKLYPDILATVGGEGEDEGGEAAKAQHESENRPASPVTATEVNAPKASTDGRIRVMDHDVTIWCGDLNYRVELARSDLFAAIERADWATLLHADQLHREMAAGHAFQGFREDVPTFLPTYKFDAGTDTFDSSPKQRLPAYCDRVLWKLRSDRSHGATIRSLYYKGVMACRGSDHKPVASLLQVSLLPTAKALTTSPPRRSGLPKRGYLAGMAARLIRQWAPIIVTSTIGAAILGYFYYKQ